MNSEFDKDISRRLLKLLTENQDLSQRQMAHKMGVSLGKVNYCLTELAKKGFIKIKRFKSAINKRSCSYIVTPSGLAEKANLTLRFLKIKIREYEEIKRQIKELSSEIEAEELQKIYPAQ